MLNATELAEHYGSEALRLQQAAGMPREIADAQLLLDWLVDGWKETHVSVTDVIQLGPNRLRHSPRPRKTVGVLEDHHWLVEKGPGITRGKRRREVWRIVKPR